MLDERPILVTIRDQQTGSETILWLLGSWEDGTFCDFMWSDGNFSCDCNRGHFLYPEHLNPFPCGTTRFSVEIRDEREHIVYSDSETAGGLR